MTATQNKRAGAAWERDFRDGMRSVGFSYEQLRMTGSFDEGDAVVMDMNNKPAYVLELKAGKMEPASFVRQAIDEKTVFCSRRNINPAGVSGVAIIKRRGCNWKDAYVLTTVRDYFNLDDSASSS